VNQPVMDLAVGRVYITSHNHGFAAALPGQVSGRELDVSAETSRAIAPGVGAAAVRHALWPRAGQPRQLNDGVVEGLRLLERPVFSAQYHPEAAPAPHDAADHFDHFCTLLERAR
jgi:carbamoyl-phosphate synthase small subunit